MSSAARDEPSVSDSSADGGVFLSRASFLLGLGASCAYLAFLVISQPTISVAGGRGWDGIFYYAMARSDLPIAELKIPHRYKARLLVPTAARSLSDLSDGSADGRDSLLVGFEIVNLAAGLIAAVLTWVFLAWLHRGRLGLAAHGVCWLLIVATQVSPLPESAWYPAQTDSVSNLFLLIVLYLALCRQRPATLLACALVFGLGTLTREHFPIFMILFALRFELGITRERLLGERNRHFALRVAGALLGSGLAFMFLIFVAGVNPLEGRAAYAFSELAKLDLGTVLAALINVYGALLLLLLAARMSTRGKRRKRPLGVTAANLALVIGVLVAISFGWSNNERFLYWGLPTLVFYFAPEIDAALRSGFAGRVAVGTATLFALVLNRVFVPIEESGVAGCSLMSIVDGSSVWVGHWVQICGARAELDVVAAYLVASGAIAGIALACRARSVPEAC